MLHNEARELLVQGYEATHDVEEIAQAYSVSKWTVYRPVGQKRKTGSVALRTSQRGRKPMLTERDLARICGSIEDQPDITIEELREKLELKASNLTIERAVNKMGYTYKKKLLHTSERERTRCTGETCSMEGKHKALNNWIIWYFWRKTE